MDLQEARLSTFASPLMDWSTAGQLARIRVWLSWHSRFPWAVYTPGVRKPEVALFSKQRFRPCSFRSPSFSALCYFCKRHKLYRTITDKEKADPIPSQTKTLA